MIAPPAKSPPRSGPRTSPDSRTHLHFPVLIRSFTRSLARPLARQVERQRPYVPPSRPPALRPPSSARRYLIHLPLAVTEKNKSKPSRRRQGQPGGHRRSVCRPDRHQRQAVVRRPFHPFAGFHLPLELDDDRAAARRRQVQAERDAKRAQGQLGARPQPRGQAHQDGWLHGEEQRGVARAGHDGQEVCRRRDAVRRRRR